MSGKYYMLVNPYIEGTMPKIFKADNSQLAAKEAYESISKYFNNSVNNFKFSLLKLKSDSVDEKSKKINLEQYGSNAENKLFNKKNFSHFTVSEKPQKNGEVNFAIQQYNGNINNLDHLVANIMKIQTKYKKAKRNVQKVNSSSQSDSQNESQSNSQSDSQSYSQSDSQTESQSDSQSYSQSDSQTESQSDSQTKQKGGKKSKYDDEDDDDSPDYFISKTYYYDPISYWYYSPSIYQLDRLYLPTFVSPLSFPYVLDLSPSIIYGTGMSQNPSVNITY
jgi:hypothetical protein